jgi:hypothetical protein
MSQRLAVGAALAVAMVAASAPRTWAKDVAVTGTGVKETYDCGGDDASIAGDSNTVTLRHCENVSVMGNNNRVDAGAPSAVSVVGANNKVTWTKGAHAPKISSVGTGAANVVSVEGGELLSGGNGSIRVDGKGNVNIAGERGSRVSIDSAGGVSVKAGGDDDLVLNEDGQNATKDCAGGGAIVNGDSNTFRFKNCKSIIVNGDHNIVDAGSVDALSVHGDSNTVTWRGTKPALHDDGKGNTIAGK